MRPFVHTRESSDSFVKSRTTDFDRRLRKKKNKKKKKKKRIKKNENGIQKRKKEKKKRDRWKFVDERWSCARVACVRKDVRG